MSLIGLKNNILNFCVYCYLFVVVVCPFKVWADITLIAPAKGATVAQMPPEAKEFYSKTSKERDAIIADEAARKELKNKIGGVSQPIQFEWNCDSPAKFTIEISETEDFSQPIISVNTRAQNAKLRNFKIAKTYYWRVKSRGNVKSDISPVFSFNTDGIAPRILYVSGASNIRDLGGRIGIDGKRIAQNKILRGAGLNANSSDGIRAGKRKISDSGIAYLVGEIGIKTDLDLRTQKELGDLNISPLGENIRFVHKSSTCYGGLFTDTGKKNYAEVFRFFCDESNYPIYLHCIGGADRTGSVAFVLNAILGVSDDELEKDWETTIFADANMDFVSEPRYHVLLKGFDAYGKTEEPYSAKVERWLLSIGITPLEISKFREIMVAEE